MIPKLLYRQCPKCHGDLARTGELRKVRGVILAEYGCVQCGKVVEIPVEGQDVRDRKSYH